MYDTTAQDELDGLLASDTSARQKVYDIRKYVIKCDLLLRSSLFF